MTRTFLLVSYDSCVATRVANLNNTGLRSEVRCEGVTPKGFLLPQNKENKIASFSWEVAQRRGSTDRTRPHPLTQKTRHSSVYCYMVQTNRVKMKVMAVGWRHLKATVLLAGMVVVALVIHGQLTLVRPTISLL